MTNGKSFYGHSLNQEQIEVAAGEVLADIGRNLESKTGVWFGSMDVQNGLLHALRQLNGARAIVLWNPRNGIDVAPGALFEAWAAQLNAMVGSDQITRPVLAQAVSAALSACYGLGGGSLLVFREGWRLMIHPLAYDHAAPVIRAVTGGRSLAELPGVN